MSDNIEQTEIKHFEPETAPEVQPPTNEENIEFVRARYPDAFAFKYAKLSIVIWCKLLNCRLSGYFHTEEEAWTSAVEWINKKEIKK